MTRTQSTATIKILSYRQNVELQLRSTPSKVLIVDDDPSHLEIYGLLLKQAGYEPVSALVRFAGAEFPTEPNINGIILDSRLNSLERSSDLAQQMRILYPQAPIVLLEDGLWPSEENAPYADSSVRRGEPAELLDTLSRVVLKSTEPPSALASQLAS